MKLIIDIPDNVYDDIEHNKGEYINTLNWAVRNGTPYEETISAYEIAGQRELKRQEDLNKIRGEEK